MFIRYHYIFLKKIVYFKTSLSIFNGQRTQFTVVFLTVAIIRFIAFYFTFPLKTNGKEG